jgi:hypothetical protein
MFDEALVQVASGQLVRLPELSTRLAIGDKGDVSIVYILSHLSNALTIFLRPTFRISCLHLEAFSPYSCPNRAQRTL